MKKSPYPARGTPAGDERVGDCKPCGAPLCRGDQFVSMMGGDLVCIGCHMGLIPKKQPGEAALV